MNEPKPAWIIAKERSKRENYQETIWLFGLHAVRDALENPIRHKLRLIITKNAADKLSEAINRSGLLPEFSDPRKFSAPIDPQSVHQGVALEVKGLNWGEISEVCKPINNGSRVVVLDRVTDPNNVGAILRSAEVFGALAVIAPLRYSAPETGALAKTASGAMERQPYLKVKNLGTTLDKLKEMGYFIIGLDSEGSSEMGNLGTILDGPIALVLGAEGPGLRHKTKDICDVLARITPTKSFGSLNVSNAVAVALYATKNFNKT